MAPLKTDRIVKESDYIEYQDYIASLKIPEIVSAPEDTTAIEKQLDELRSEIRMLKTTVDSLGSDHAIHKEEFMTLKRDIEGVLTKLMSGDISGTKIKIKGEETFDRKISQRMFDTYKVALDACLDHKYDAAIQEFQYFLDSYPNSTLSENCRYWIALSHFSKKDYPKAAQGFKAVLLDSRFTHKDDDASIMLGITNYRMNMQPDALVEFHKFILNYPESEYREMVMDWIRKLSS